MALFSNFYRHSNAVVDHACLRFKWKKKRRKMKNFRWKVKRKIPFRRKKEEDGELQIGRRKG
jgi:hypothetical protein